MKRYIIESDGWGCHEAARVVRDKNGNSNARILCIDTERLTVSVVPEPRLVCQYGATKDGPWSDYANPDAQRAFDAHKGMICHILTDKHARIVEKCGDEVLRVVETWSPPGVTYKVEFFGPHTQEWLTSGNAECIGGTRKEADAALDGAVRLDPRLSYRIIDSTGNVVRTYEPPAPKPERWRIYWSGGGILGCGEWADVQFARDAARHFTLVEHDDHEVRRVSDGKLDSTFRWIPEVPGRVVEERHE